MCQPRNFEIHSSIQSFTEVIINSPTVVIATYIKKLC